MVGLGTLNPAILVRIQAPEHFCKLSYNQKLHMCAVFDYDLAFILFYVSYVKVVCKYC